MTTGNVIGLILGATIAVSYLPFYLWRKKQKNQDDLYSRAIRVKVEDKKFNR